MKTIISIFLSGVFTVASLAADKAKQTKKTSDKPLVLPDEVAAYYVQLTEEDPDVQKQVEGLTAHSRAKAGGLFKLEDPHAFQWFLVSETRTNSGDSLHGHFLVIQTAGRWRTKDSDADMALVADFDVDYDETTPTGIHLTITFLGFRRSALSAVAATK